MPHSKEIFCQKQTQFGFREDKFDPRGFARFAALARAARALVVIVNYRVGFDRDVTRGYSAAKFVGLNRGKESRWIP